MRRPLSIAFAALLVAAIVAPSAQASSRRYWFQVYPGAGRLRISVVLLYKNKERHGSYTPRQASYDGTVYALSCNPPVAQPYVDIGSYIPDSAKIIKLRKGSFSYSEQSEIPDAYGQTVGNVNATVTGKPVKKKPGVRKQMRVDGTVSVLDYNYPFYGFHNCTSGGPISYSATPCRPTPGSIPPYMKKSLPLCLPP